MSSGQGVDVLVGLGANVGDPFAQLAFAVEKLGGVLRGVRTSSVYRTEPVGFLKQPDFLNLVIRGRTRLTPEELLDVAQELEAALGRLRPFPNAPRTLDVDLLAYGRLVLETERLTLPHPRLHQRAFVLVPLAELAARWRHPLLDRTAAELLAALAPAERVERVGRLSGRGGSP